MRSLDICRNCSGMDKRGAVESAKTARIGAEMELIHVMEY